MGPRVSGAEMRFNPEFQIPSLATRCGMIGIVVFPYKGFSS